jgi:hypothetical protein
VAVCYDRQVLGVVSPTGWQHKGFGGRVTSALRLELTYRSSQAMRISAILFILYFGVWGGADRCRKRTLFPIECTTLTNGVQYRHRHRPLQKDTWPAFSFNVNEQSPEDPMEFKAFCIFVCLLI